MGKRDLWVINNSPKIFMEREGSWKINSPPNQRYGEQ